MQVLYRKQAEAPSQSQSIDRSEGTRSPSPRLFPIVAQCLSKPTHDRWVASIVFAQQVRTQDMGSSLPIVSELGRAELKSSGYMRSKETERRLTRRSSSRIRKVSSEQTILSDVACTAARSSGGRPRRCLERLRTPFDDHIRGFCRARATNNRTRQSEGTTSRRDAKEAGLSNKQQSMSQTCAVAP